MAVRQGTSCHRSKIATTPFPGFDDIQKPWSPCSSLTALRMRAPRPLNTVETCTQCIPIIYITNTCRYIYTYNYVYVYLQCYIDYKNTGMPSDCLKRNTFLPNSHHTHPQFHGSSSHHPRTHSLTQQHLAVATGQVPALQS